MADENIELSAEQEAAVDAALEGANLFITGSAGVGKSLLVTRVVKKLEANGKASLSRRPGELSYNIVYDELWWRSVLVLYERGVASWMRKVDRLLIFCTLLDQW